MDLRKLKTLIDLVSESNIHELEITEAEGKVRIVKGSYAVTPAAAHAPATAHTTLASAAQRPEMAAEPEGKIVKSPMVGTFYRSPSPGAQPFVEIGSPIKEGEPVCVIEAMKIMNEIESDATGKVKRILCENGQAVEFGQPMFVVE